MPPGSKHHRYLALGEEIERAHHIVAGFDLVVDVLDARAIRRKQRDGVVNLVDAQQRRVADPVADPGVAYFGQKTSSRAASVVQSPIWLNPVIPASRSP